MNQELIFYPETSFTDSPHGKIPIGWNLKLIEEVAQIHDSKRIPLSEKERSGRKGQYPYCGANGIIDYIDDYIFDGEYVLLAEDGGSYGKFDNTAYVMNGKFWVNNHAHVMQAFKGKTMNYFLKYTLDFLDLNRYIVGTTRKKLNQEQMRKISFLSPTINEQKRIVKVLSCVDLVIQKTDEVIAKTERLKKGLMQKLLTEGIGHKEFKETEMGKIPESWRIVKLGEAFDIYDCKHRTPKYAKKGIPIVRPRDVKAGLLNLEVCLETSPEDYYDLTSKYAPKEGDIIFTRNASFGIACYVGTAEKFSIGQDVVVITTDNQSNKFLFYLLNSDLMAQQIQKYSSGSTFKRINLHLIRKLKFALPPKTEQERIAVILTAIDSKLEIENTEKRGLQKIKQGLMDLLLTGKVRVKVD
jgi:type I restriction enzyme S subunit